MRLIQVGLASIDSTVGAVHDNAAKVLAMAQRAAAQHVTVLAFPEQVLGGYCPEDLLHWRAFVDAQWQALRALRTQSRELDVVLAVGLLVQKRDAVFNVAACLYRGELLGLVPKEKLPTYQVFYEGRTLCAGRPGQADTWRSPDGEEVPFGDLLFEFDFGTLALEVCEDAWSPDGPLQRRAYAGAELVLNLSASPYRVGMHETRRELVATRAADAQLAYGYVNAVGANDSLVYDGGALLAQNGRRVLDAPHFCEGLHTAVLDLDRTTRLRGENSTFRNDRAAFLRAAERPDTGAALPTVVEFEGAGPDRTALRYPPPAAQNFFLPQDKPQRSARAQFAEDLLDVLALGTGSYFEKVGAFDCFGIALSGGRDSLLVLWIAARYVERKFAACSAEERARKRAELLHAFYMPSRHSSAETEAAARKAAEELGARFTVASIEDAFAQELEAARQMLGAEPEPLAVQNIQARLRAERMWTWSNSTRALLLQTSNMSEKAVGYTTIGGDLEGALSVIANLPKTVVNFLLDHLLEQTGSEAIRMTLAKPASAELAPDQEDERDLMPYPVLDACVALYAGEKLGLDELCEVLVQMFPEHSAETLQAWAQRFTRLLSAAVYKWTQAPLALHVGALDLDRERALQLPVVHKLQWLTPARR